MKYVLGFALLIGCGSTPVPEDGGADAALKEAATADVSDATPADAAGTGVQCQLGANDCAPGLLCCPEPTHMPDASTIDLCEQPTNGNCPLFP